MFYDFEAHVKARIKEVLQEFDISPEILVYDMSTEHSISYHFIVSNIAFSTKTCQGLCELICKNQIWEQLVDRGVYKRIQMMRIEGSKKYGTTSIHKPYIDISKSFIGNVSSITHSYLNINMREKQDVKYNSIMFLPHIILAHYKIREVRGDAMFLDRIRPSMCMQCNRVHTSENAVILRSRTSNPIFMCWRFYARKRHTYDSGIERFIARGR
jgi:hypothetical protein